MELKGEICIGHINFEIINVWMIFKAKGIDKVTERLSGVMVITMGPGANLMLFGFKALDLVIELSL